MKRRSYTPRKRKEAVDTGRDRILAAAREVFQAPTEVFSIEAVAKRAGVSRMTIYNQFESKAGLLEALFDSLAVHGPFKRMSEVFGHSDPRVSLDEFVAIMGEFWTYSRGTHLKLRAASIVDPELAAAVARRNERRRYGVAELIRRLSDQITPVVPRSELVDLLFVLLSFDTFNALAGPDREPRDVVPTMRKLVHATLGLRQKRSR